MQPDLSFVIAAFNAEATLGRAIASALAQRDATVEIVVVDDCSSDGTVAVAESFARDGVRVVALKKNRGRAGPAMRGSKPYGAAGSPSRFRRYRLSRRIARMIPRGEAIERRDRGRHLDVVHETTGRRDAMFTAAQLESLAESACRFHRRQSDVRSDFTLGYMKPIVERQFVKEHALGYDETLRVGEDYILLASALAKGARCVVEPEIGYSYHVRAGSFHGLEPHHVGAMLDADAIFCAIFARRCSHGCTSAADPQPAGGGGFPEAGPASGNGSRSRRSARR